MSQSPSHRSEMLFMGAGIFDITVSGHLPIHDTWRLAFFFFDGHLLELHDFYFDIFITAFHLRVDCISVTFRTVLPVLTRAPLSPWIIALVSVMDLWVGCCESRPF